VRRKSFAVNAAGFHLHRHAQTILLASPHSPQRLSVQCFVQGVSGPALQQAFHELLRPIDTSVSPHLLWIVDPEGGAQDVHRFSTRQDAASKNPRNAADGRFASALESFLW
jgi:hypothetical protein